LVITAFDSLFDTGTVDPVALSVLAPDWISATDGDPSFLYDRARGVIRRPRVRGERRDDAAGHFFV
jgi:hypothetical protein